MKISHFPWKFCPHKRSTTTGVWQQQAVFTWWFPVSCYVSYLNYSVRQVCPFFSIYLFIYLSEYRPMAKYFVLGIVIQFCSCFVSPVILGLDMGSFPRVAPAPFDVPAFHRFFISFYFLLAYPHFLVWWSAPGSSHTFPVPAHSRIGHFFQEPWFLSRY